MRKTNIKIHFTYLGTKDITWILKACCIINDSFSTKCRSFHNFISYKPYDNVKYPII